MDKTLIGKNGYLFLQNDSCRELDVHCNNLCLVNDNFYIKYDKYKYIGYPNWNIISFLIFIFVYRLRYFFLFIYL